MLSRAKSRLLPLSPLCYGALPWRDSPITLCHPVLPKKFNFIGLTGETIEK